MNNKCICSNEWKGSKKFIQNKNASNNTRYVIVNEDEDEEEEESKMRLCCK